jgi:hypothetical protein
MYQTWINYYNLMNEDVPETEREVLQDVTLSEERNESLIFIRKNSYKCRLNLRGRPLMTSRNIWLFLTPPPPIVTLFITKALVISSQKA